MCSNVFSLLIFLMLSHNIKRPKSPVLLNAGHYLFVDFSNPVQVGDISWLQSPIMEPNVALCMSFWYITSFDGTNLIKVLKRPAVPTNSSSIKVWSIFDLPAPSWTYGRIAIFSNVPFYVSVFFNNHPLKKCMYISSVFLFISVLCFCLNLQMHLHNVSQLNCFF